MISKYKTPSDIVLRYPEDPSPEIQAPTQATIKNIMFDPNQNVSKKYI